MNNSSSTTRIHLKRAERIQLKKEQAVKLALLDDVHITANNTAVLLACCYAASEMLVERYGLSEDARLEFAQTMVDRAVKKLGELVINVQSITPSP